MPRCSAGLRNGSRATSSDAAIAETAVDRIRVLPEDVAIQIAAGEVIERPASVVKELLENALDAGARRVTIELEDGGLATIRVADDGYGMTANDAVLAFTRHATSKIRGADDLLRIATFGFRGEALPSIASVGAVELVTRAAGATAGIAVRTEGGVVTDVRDAGAATGTTVTVRELFAPVPARRKFLKSVATELGHVVDLVTRESLAAPHVHFRVVHQGRELAAYPPVATLEERARQVLGRDRVRGGRVLDERRLGLGVRGFLLSPQLSFASGRYVYTYVNGRAIRDRAVSHAIVEGYASLVPRGRWPGAIVLLEVPPADVDVNVHPAKHEVRFRLAHVVHDTIVAAVRRALATAGAAEPGATERVAEALQRYVARADASGVLGLGGDDPRSPHATEAVGAATGDVAARAADALGIPRTAAAARPATDTGFAQLRFVGQIFRGYIVCEGADRLVLIDQHAAHERVAFERLRAEYARGAIERQALLLPVPVTLDPGCAEAIAAARERLAALGFEVDAFGESTFLVRGVPALLGDDDPALLLEDLADSLAEHGSHLATSESIDEILGRIACHSVVRVGRALDARETDALLVALDALTYGSNCPHGRPVSVEFTRGQLERMFGR